MTHPAQVRRGTPCHTCHDPTMAYRDLQDEGLIIVKHGSGAVVASRTRSERSQDALLRPLRTALTDLVLSGLSPAKIHTVVLRELRLAAKESR
jgi:DNA-binding transcriptional regulator YhcF (GntR family)